MKFIDLSHSFEDGMPGFKMKNEDGSYTEYSAKIYPFITHEYFKNIIKRQGSLLPAQEDGI